MERYSALREAIANRGVLLTRSQRFRRTMSLRTPPVEAFRTWSGRVMISRSGAMQSSAAGCRLTSSLVPAARRSVVERTFAWLGQYRRLSKDYEQFTIASEAVIHLAMIQLMVRRVGDS